MKSLLNKSCHVHKCCLFILILLLPLSACDRIGTDSLIEIENEAEQFKKMEQELKDLKIIKVKPLAPERFEDMQEKIYENYFRYKDDTEHQEEKPYDDVECIIYRTDDIYQLMEWRYDFVSYSGNLFGEGYIYETTEEQVIREETEKLLGLLGLEYNNEEDGYVIDRMVTNEDNSIKVYLKGYIDGKQLSLADPQDVELSTAGNVEILFGNNQIIGVHLVRLLEIVEVRDYEEEVLVDSPQKAYKLLDNHISTVQGGARISETSSGKISIDTSEGQEKIHIDTARIAYAISQEEDGIYTMRPVAEFYEKVKIPNEQPYVYQVDLTTKKVAKTIY